MENLAGGVGEAAQEAVAAAAAAAAAAAPPPPDNNDGADDAAAGLAGMHIDVPVIDDLDVALQMREMNQPFTLEENLQKSLEKSLPKLEKFSGDASTTRSRAVAAAQKIDLHLMVHKISSTSAYGIIASSHLAGDAAVGYAVYCERMGVTNLDREQFLRFLKDPGNYGTPCMTLYTATSKIFAIRFISLGITLAARHSSASAPSTICTVNGATCPWTS